MALTGGGVNTDRFSQRPRCCVGKSRQRALDLGHPSVVGSGALCPSALGWLQRITTPHGGCHLNVIFGSEPHTEGSGIRTLAPRYYRKSMLLLFRFHFLDVCRHLRTCCACTCKDYVCIHSQPKWLCHFGSSLILY